MTSASSGPSGRMIPDVWLVCTEGCSGNVSVELSSSNSSHPSGVSAHFGTGKVYGTSQDSASVNCVFAGYLCPSFVPDPWCIKNCSSQLFPLDVCDTQRSVCDGQRGRENSVYCSQSICTHSKSYKCVIYF